MKKLSILIITALLSITTAHAEMTAEQLVASKIKADMTYRQLMEILGSASSMMHEGIIRENQQMVKEASNIIIGHPAPNHNPWSIMNEEDQKGFKKSLKFYNKDLDVHAERAAMEAAKGNWQEARKASNDLMNSCTTCHAMWRTKVK
jgi:soluble cytochrome b562